MKFIVKYGMMFLLIYFGTKSIMDVGRAESLSMSLYIDFFIYLMFVGIPATTYWGQSIEKAFNNEEPEENNEEENN